MRDQLLQALPLFQALIYTCERMAVVGGGEEAISVKSALAHKACMCVGEGVDILYSV